MEGKVVFRERREERAKGRDKTNLSALCEGLVYTLESASFTRLFRI